MALSQDGGSTWSFPTSITQPVLNPTFSNAGGLNGAECFEDTCMAVGSYQDLNSIQRPLLALSSNQGGSWSFPEAITNPVLTPSFGSGGDLSMVTCSDRLCIAVGYYDDNHSITRRLLALSRDKGLSWSFPVAITDPTLTPAFNSNGYLIKASCNGNVCIATGYYSSDGSNFIPLLAITQDAGENWHFERPTPTPEIEGNGYFRVHIVAVVFVLRQDHIEIKEIHTDHFWLLAGIMQRPGRIRLPLLTQF